MQAALEHSFSYSRNNLCHEMLKKDERELRQVLETISSIDKRRRIVCHKIRMSFTNLFNFEMLSRIFWETAVTDGMG